MFAPAGFQTPSPLFNSPFSPMMQSSCCPAPAPTDRCYSADSTMFSQAFSAMQQAMMTEMLLGFLMGMLASFAQNGNAPSGLGNRGFGGQALAGLAGNYGGSSTPIQSGGAYGGPQAEQVWNGASRSGKGFSFKAGMAIDTDGVGSSRGDRWHQNQTSMRLAGGGSLNADTTPYMVLPPQLAKQYGCKPGDLALVKYKGKVSPAVFGDVGPRHKLGEGSTRLAANLGINTDPNRGGTSSGVEYQVFPGSGRGVKWTHENSTTEALWQRIQSMGLNK